MNVTSIFTVFWHKYRAFLFPVLTIFLPFKPFSKYIFAMKELENLVKQQHSLSDYQSMHSVQGKIVDFLKLQTLVELETFVLK